MCRLLGWVARTPVTGRDLLGDDALAGFQRLSLLHLHGWGLSGEGADGPVLRRSTAQADTDPEFVAATTATPMRSALVHLRWATPGMPVEICNTHPFRHGDWTFAHNGAIYPVERREEILGGPWREQLDGTTDSERYFLAVLAELDVPGTDVPTALARVTGRLARQFQPTSLNALLHSPQSLYAVSCHDPASAPAAAPPSESAVPSEDLSGYFDLQYRVQPDSVVVASSGFVPRDADDWQVVTPDSVLVIDRHTLQTQEVPLASGLGAPSEARSTLAG